MRSLISLMGGSVVTSIIVMVMSHLCLPTTLFAPSKATVWAMPNWERPYPSAIFYVSNTITLPIIRPAQTALITVPLMSNGMALRDPFFQLLRPQKAAAVASLRPSLIMGDSAEVPLVMVQPHYPRRCAEAGLEAVVTVRFDLDATGRVANPEVVERGATCGFNRAALLALKKFRFQPKRQHGVSVESRDLIYRFRFNLNQSPS